MSLQYLTLGKSIIVVEILDESSCTVVPMNIYHKKYPGNAPEFFRSPTTHRPFPYCIM